jgi:hypothetical protein
VRRESQPKSGVNNELFCQLNEIHVTKAHTKVWKETARSLKFIELVEDSGRWSQPCVATLSHHSLVELRKFVLNGKVMLDFQFLGTDLKQLMSTAIFWMFFFKKFNMKINEKKRMLF